MFSEKTKTEEKLNTGSQQLNANLHILAPHTAAAASTVRLAHPALTLLLILCFIPLQWNLMFLLKGHGNETCFLSVFLLAIIEMNTHSEYEGFKFSNFEDSWRRKLKKFDSPYNKKQQVRAMNNTGSHQTGIPVKNTILCWTPKAKFANAFKYQKRGLVGRAKIVSNEIALSCPFKTPLAIPLEKLWHHTS